MKKAMLFCTFPHRWLCNESLPVTSRRWAIEGLAYLTFDADVKEDLVQDKNALQAMFQLAKVFWPSTSQFYTIYSTGLLNVFAVSSN